MSQKNSENKLKLKSKQKFLSMTKMSILFPSRHKEKEKKFYFSHFNSIRKFNSISKHIYRRIAKNEPLKTFIKGKREMCQCVPFFTFTKHHRDPLREGIGKLKRLFTECDQNFLTLFLILNTQCSLIYRLMSFFVC